MTATTFGRPYSSDTVSIRNLKFKSFIRNDPKDLLITANLTTCFEHAGVTDDLKYSINYAVLARQFQGFADTNKNRSFPSYQNLGWHLLKEVVFGVQKCTEVSLSIGQKLNGGGMLIYELNKKNESGQILSQGIRNDHVKISELSIMTIIGVFTHERLMKQPVVLDIDISLDLDGQSLITGLDEQLPNRVAKYVGSTNFKTVEALALNVAKLVLKGLPEDVTCSVHVTKPDAIEDADGVGVTACRSRDQVSNIDEMVEFDPDDVTIDRFTVPNLNSEAKLVKGKGHRHIAYLAFGSNEGDQLGNITEALNSLETKGIHIVATSSLYRSKPMYYLEQQDFFNGCVKVSTTLSPQELLKELKDIEYNILKRVKQFENGPRSIDLDIILYDSIILSTPDLNIPHIRMLERSFVLLPLCELVPPNMLHPVTAESLHQHLDQLLGGQFSVGKEKQESSDLMTLVPIPKVNGGVKFMEYDDLHNKSRTQLMAILNVTPDSFSDGSKENLVLQNCMAKVDDMVANKVDIVDVGGCSTRPNSLQPSEDEELARVLPVIKAIKEKYGDRIIVSVDTYRSKVAEESIKVGADIINDISAGLFDDRMYSVVAQTGVPYIINHTRGNIDTMTKLTDYSATPDGKLVLFNERRTEGEIMMSEIGKELSTLVSKMYKSGIRRWQLILDPGLGFAKGLRANVAVIKNVPYFKQYKQLDKETGEYISFDNLPLLLGPSRKRFIGTITGKNTAKERVEGTGACVAAGIGFGSDIVRVHDYKEMKDVCLMCDAIYKDIY
ncbi:DEKNAAC100719 [Brettanomyces naardenensis]|uniref:DEKNAAC100719 n=1 Tax=Brettanomyces naardenensis TaxID=13370 RepID=A0A448YEB6_BRENA|nr:DEKNAAC100719 [Brettanomyces naardenensis]